jgi:DNA repair protein RadA/Sms
MVEEVIATSAKKSKTVLPGLGGASTPRRLSEIGEGVNERLLLPIQEFARVLGGGIVPGSIVLIGGDPGIGKSTLLLQTALEIAAEQRVLYVSGEESERQIKMRALRLSRGEDSSRPELAVRNYRMICFWSPRPIWM